MKIFDLLSMCVRNLVRRKFRTVLTVLGVIIGTTSIVMMISLGIGISRQQEEQLKMWGDLTIIQVSPGGGGGQNGSTAVLDDEVVAQIQAIDKVDIASPFVYMNIDSQRYVTGGKGYKYKLEYLEIYGLYPEAIEKLGYKIEKGEWLPTGKTKTLTVLFGSNTVYDFRDTRKKFNNMRNGFPDENGNIEDPFFDPLTTSFKLVLPPTDSDNSNAKRLEFEFEVSGTMVGEQNKNGAVWGIFMPLDDMNDIIAKFNKENGIKTSKKEKQSYDQVYVKVKTEDMNSIPDIQQQITDMGFYTWSMDEQRKEMQKSTQQVQIILGGLGAVSLLVSAISITNTMIMSVYERTREIGVMKVLGCLVGNIRSLFLLEAGFIGFFGGIIGVALSYALSFLLNYFGGALASGGGGRFFRMGMFGGSDNSSISVIPPWLVLLGIVFATAIGLVSGFYPANRAVKISALEAIKQE